jgi:exopolysaccharide biosynthesis polyprenyl glycosylphosphotransferase
VSRNSLTGHPAVSPAPTDVAGNGGYGSHAIAAPDVDGLIAPAAPGTSPRRPLSRRYRKVAIGLVVTDGMCAVIALFVAHLVLLGWAQPKQGLLWLMAIVPVVWIASFHAFGLYGVRHLSALEEFRRVIGATCVATSVVVFVRAWSDIPPYRRWLVLTWLLAVALELGTRRVWRCQLRRLRRNGSLAARTVILGTNDEAQRLRRALDQPALGFHLLGHIATADRAEQVSAPGQLAVVGHLGVLDETIRTLQVDCVFVASTAVSADDVVHVAHIAREADVEVRVSANLADILISRLSVQSFGDVLALSVKPVRMSPVQAAVKRMFDVGVASIALLISLPVMALIAVAVRLSSPGPILFRQERVTKGGRVFRMIKFRTMVTELPEGRTIDLTAPFFKLRDDPRLTRVGRILRITSLDELPQLWQVIRGDLSLVGPRPLPAVQVAANQELLSPRHEVRAGITGWWQINGRSSVAPHEAIRMDLFYIENWSLSLDLFIILKTLGAVVSFRDAA